MHKIFESFESKKQSPKIFQLRVSATECWLGRLMLKKFNSVMMGCKKSKEINAFKEKGQLNWFCKSLKLRLEIEAFKLVCLSQVGNILPSGKQSTYSLISYIAEQTIPVSMYILLKAGIKFNGINIYRLITLTPDRGK